MSANPFRVLPDGGKWRKIETDPVGGNDNLGDLSWQKVELNPEPLPVEDVAETRRRLLTPQERSTLSGAENLDTASMLAGVGEGVRVSLGINPDVAADVQRLVNLRGLPADTVMRNLPEIKNREQAQHILDQIVMNEKAFPKTAAIVRNPWQLAAAQDSLEDLQKLEGMQTSYFGGFAGRRWFDARETAKGMAQAGINALKIPGDIYDEAYGIKAEPGILDTAAKYYQPNTRPYLDNYDRAAALVTGAAAQMVPQVAAGIATGGATLPALLGAGQVLGSTYGDLREDGIGAQRAALSAIADAAGEGALDYLPMHQLLSRFSMARQGLKAAGETGVGSALKTAGWEGLKQGATEATTEAAQQYVSDAAKELARSEKSGGDIGRQIADAASRYIAGLDATTYSGIEQGLAVLPVAMLLGGSAQLAGHYLNAAESARQHEASTQLRQTVAQMGLTRRAPEQVRQFIRDVAEDGVKSAFVDPAAVETLLQSQPEPEAQNELLATLGLTPERYTEAVATGKDLELPLERWLTLPENVAAPLQEDIRFSPDGLSRRELANYQTDLAQMQTDDAARQEREPEFVQRARRDLARAPEAARQGLTKDQVNAALDVYLAGARQLAARGGKWANAEEYLRDKNLHFRIGDKTYSLTENRWVEEGQGPRAEGQGEQLNQATFSSHRDNITDWVQGIVARNKDDLGSHFSLGTGNSIAPDLEFNIPPEIVFHNEKKHPGNTDSWNDIVQAINNIQIIGKGNKSRYNGEPFIAYSKVGEQPYGVAFEVFPKGEAKITTIFKDKENKIKGWIKSEGQGTSGIRQLPRSGYRISLATSDKPILQREEPPVNPETLEQGGARGAVTFADTATLVSLFKAGDISTLLHEAAHVFFHDMKELVAASQADSQLQADYTALLDYAGGEWNVKAQEKIARAFEAYLMEGKAPSSKLAAAFARFKDWLLAVYRSLSGLDVELNDRVRAVFDRLLASQAEIEDAAAYYQGRQELLDLLPDTDPEARQAALAAREVAGRKAQNHNFRRRLNAYLKTFGGREVLAEQAANEVAARPVYRAFADLARTGLDFKDVRDEYGQAAAEALKRQVSALRRHQASRAEAVSGLGERHQQVMETGGRAALEAHRQVLERSLAEAEKAAAAAKPGKRDQSRFQLLSAPEGLMYEIRVTRAKKWGLREGYVTGKVLAVESGLLDSIMNSDAFTITNGKRLSDWAEDTGQEREVREWILEALGKTKKQAEADFAAAVNNFALEAVAGPARQAAREIESMLNEIDLALADTASTPANLARAAAQSGLADADALLAAAQSEPLLPDAARIRLDEIIREKEGELRQLPEEVPGGEDLHSPEALKALEIEANLLADRARREKKYRARRVDAQALRGAAKQILSEKSVRQAVSYKAFARAEAKAAREAFTAAAAGDLEKALAAKRRQMLNHALVLEAVYLRDQVESWERRIRDLAKRPGMPVAYRPAIVGLAVRYGLGTDKMMENPPPEFDLHKLQDGDDILPAGRVIADWIMEGRTPEVLDETGAAAPGDWQDLTFGQFRELHDAFAWLGKLASDEVNRKDLLDGERISDLVAKVLPALQALPEFGGNFDPAKYANYPPVLRGLIPAALNALNGGIAAFECPTLLAKAIDGNVNLGKSGRAGPAERMLSYALADADAESRTRQKGLAPEVEKRIVEPLLAMQKRLEQAHGKILSLDGRPLTELVPFPLESQRYSGLQAWTAERLLVACLNLGNEGNYRSVREGFGLTDEQLDLLRRMLTADEWQQIQGIWDFLDTLWPEVAKAYEAIYGTVPPKVEPQGFATRTADGQVVTLRGGYYPLVVDSRVDATGRVATAVEADLFESSMAAVAHKKGPKNSFTKERQGTRLPPRLDSGHLLNHVKLTVHYATHAGIIRDLYQVVSHPDFKAAFVRAFGLAQYGNFVPWLKHVARPDERLLRGQAESWIDRQRKRVATGAFFLNLASGIRQVTGLLPMIQRVGWGTAMDGYRQWLKSPKTLQEQIFALSPYMESRYRETRTREQAELMQSLNPVKEGFITVAGKRISRQEVHDFGYLFMRVFAENLLTHPVWIGEYNRALRETGDATEARRRADEVIANTNPSARPLDLPAWLRSENGLVRICTMFTSYLVKSAGVHVNAVRAWRAGQLPFADLMGIMLYWDLLPAAGLALLNALIKDKEPEAKDFMWAIYDNLFGAIPGLAEAPGWFRYHRAPDVPVFEGFTRLFPAIEKTGRAFSGGDAAEAAWAVGSVLDYWALDGVPLSQRVKILLEGAADLSAGESYNPLRLVAKPAKEKK